MKTEFEYIVLGLGGLGSGAAYWLSRRAKSEVLGLEQFELGHDRGESQDHSRIIRLSYHSAAYVRLAQRAYESWSSLEEELGQKLIVKTGGLDLWPDGAVIPMPDYTGSLQECGIPFEVLNAGEIRKRFPQFHVTDDITGLFQSDGGIAPAAKCTDAHQRLARQHGATLLERTPVTAIRELGGEFEIHTPDQTFRCRKLIVAGGPWSNPVLAHFNINLPLTITQEQVTYFAAPRLEDYMPDRFPVWIWMDEPSFYGLPVYGAQGTKVGQDVGGKEVTPETRTYEPDLNALSRVQRFLQQYLPGALGKILYTKSCLYTLTPDRDFVIDALPQNANCVVTIGAGHAYKYASVIGRILSELAIDGSTPSDIETFRIDRPILRETNPPKSFMI